MSDLANRECVPCRGGVPPLKGEDLQKLKASSKVGLSLTNIT